MMALIQEIPYAILLAGAALLGLWWSNFFYDHGIKNWQSRKVGHFFGGVAFLLCALLFSSFIWTMILATLFTLLLGLAHFVKPNAFRGVGGTGRGTKALSEVYFPLVALPVVGLGWGLWNRPVESVACLLTMAWGDCLTGWVRGLKYTKPTKGWEGSVVMLAVCLVISWAFLKPLWLGASVAFGATAVEFLCGDVSAVKWLRWADDNWAIPVVSAFIFFGGLYISGLL
jgi:dolichol kinase